MKDLDVLTWKVIEEAAELQKVLATANQIGWDATHPSAKAPNYELALHELDDLGDAIKDLKAAIYDYLYETQGAPVASSPPREASQAKG